ncbi:MAG: hypothetical protein ACM3IJ_01250 [Candidatus Levyibacteriota bacterium]
MKLFAAFASSALILMLFAFLILSFVAPLKNSTLSITGQDQPETSLYFSPMLLKSACYKNETVDIFADTQQNSISSAQIELSYNPSDFSDFSIRSADDNFLGDSESYQVTLSEVRPEYGRASLSLELSPSQNARKGTGRIGTISFTATPASGIARILFLNKSTVMGQKNRISLLRNTTPLTISCF